MNEFRHVCFKDLENYVRKDDYFENYTDVEKQAIRTNLGIASSTGVIEGSYNEIKQLVLSNQLLLQNKYVVTDFQTIYTSNTGETWGLNINPSKVYSVILTPTSSNTFDPRVSLLYEGMPLNWEVRYDFNEESLPDGTTTKGKITYLKDQNNNSAYYDFKNYKFRVNLKSSDIQGLPFDVSLNVFTFSKLQGMQVVDNSDDESVYNNQFDEDCWNNVFVGATSNNHFYGGFKNNLFAKGCEYNKFEWNMTNNKFTEKVSYTQGSVKNAIVNTTNYDSSVSKEFRMLQVSNTSEPVFVVTYFDGDTLTTQVIKLTTNG